MLSRTPVPGSRDATAGTIVQEELRSSSLPTQVRRFVMRRLSHFLVPAAAVFLVACKETPRPSSSDPAPPLGRVEPTRSAASSSTHASDDSASRGVGAPQTPAPASGVRTPALTDSAFILLVRTELAALDTTLTLSDWRAKHPADSVVLFSNLLKDYSHNEWCARSTPRGTAGATAFVRHAYFYAPAPPPELQPPTASSALADSCRLGAIWIESPLSGNGATGTPAQDLITGLRRWYGQETPIDGELAFVGAAYWSPVGQWRSGGVTVIAALDPSPVASPETPTLRAMAFASPSTLGYVTHAYEFARAAPLWESVFAERALGLVGAGSAESGPVRQLLREAQEDRREYPDWKSWSARATGVVRDWVTAAQARGARERAAALLVADLALDLPGLRVIVASDSTARKVLGALGAEFAYAELGEIWLYTHSWRRMAQRLVPSGPIADLALLSQVEIGFDDAGMCSAGEEEFRRVIAEGEPFLLRLQERSDRAELHYLLGLAYADIVGLADGISEYGSPDYAAEVPAARARGIQHLRQALSLDPRGRNARHAWVTAWRLQAGLPPLSLRFFCVYD